MNRGVFVKVLVIVGLLVAIGVLWVRDRTGFQQSTTARQPAAQPNALEYASDAIIVHYHERRPYYITTQDGVHGMVADKVNEIFRRAGIPFRWQKTPAKRQLERIRHNEGRECAAGWFKNIERLTFAKFTRPVFQDGPTVALARSDNNRIVSDRPIDATLSDRGLRPLLKDTYSYGPFIDDKLETFKLDAVITSADNLRMLKMIHAGRADYFFISMEEAHDLIAFSGLPAKDFKIVTFSDMPMGNKRYLMCSRKVKDATMEGLNKAIQALHNR